jgi:hypothetical protein
MKLTAYPGTEPNGKAWRYRLLLGPAAILDGLVETITLGRYTLGAKLDVATKLARSRCAAVIDIDGLS